MQAYFLNPELWPGQLWLHYFMTRNSYMITKSWEGLGATAYLREKYLEWANILRAFSDITCEWNMNLGLSDIVSHCLATWISESIFKFLNLAMFQFTSWDLHILFESGPKLFLLLQRYIAKSALHNCAAYNSPKMHLDKNGRPISLLTPFSLRNARTLLQKIRYHECGHSL